MSMSNPLARRAISRPICPRPTMPRHASCTSWPNQWVGWNWICQPPPRSQRSLSEVRRAAPRMRAKARSAVDLARTPGVVSHRDTPSGGLGHVHVVQAHGELADDAQVGRGIQQVSVHAVHDGGEDPVGVGDQRVKLGSRRGVSSGHTSTSATARMMSSASGRRERVTRALERGMAIHRQ